MSNAKLLLAELLKDEKKVRPKIRAQITDDVSSREFSPTRDSSRDTKIMQLKNEYDELRTNNSAKLAEIESALEKKLEEEIQRLNCAENTEREKIAQEELQRFNSQVMERKAMYMKDYESYQKKVLRDLEWRYCRRSFIPDCNCKKCYLKKMGVTRKRTKKTEKTVVEKKSETINMEKKTSDSPPAPKISHTGPKVSSSPHPVARKH